ncbi:MAG: Ca2+:H+ antiporter [Gammaproteobacteria bacterium]|jgi:Ca2+:H+ antiporter|nr:Ca2+:H+ antiporter [Gammaproteobacteria bacterium]
MTNIQASWRRGVPELPLWTILAPVLAGIVMLLAGYDWGSGGIFVAVIALSLAASVFAAVHHAEVVAHRIGEPYGSLVLALAVTLIEVALIFSLMVAGGAEATALARDTVFAAVMIILNGIIGLCLLLGGLRHSEQTFSLDGVSAALVALSAIVVLTLVFPNFTITTPGPYYSRSQLVLIAIVSLAIYGAFVFAQTIGHRGIFLQEDLANSPAQHASRPSNAVTAAGAILLLACLVTVVLLAKKLAPSLEAAVMRVGAPNAVVGVIIAAIVLLPEALAALRAARADRLQTSLNLALGSALASIGLTIPAVSALSLYMDTQLTLGIDTKSTVLLILSLFITAIALRTGRTIVLHGIVLLVIFVVYLFMTVIP